MAWDTYAVQAGCRAGTSVPAPPDGKDEQSPQDWAIAAVFQSAMEDSLAAAPKVR